MNMFTQDSSFKDYKALLQESEQRSAEIRVGDKFSISVWKHDELSIGSIYGIYNSNQIFGKWQLVKPDSTILFPKIGTVKLVGYTVQEAEAVLTNYYEKFIVNPLVTIQIHSHNVELLGEVTRPGKIVLFHNKHTIVEALASTGGYTDYAHISKTRLIRNGIAYNIDLTEITPKELSELYLMPGDYLYIPTKQSKKVDQKASILLVAVSVFTTLLILFKG